MEYKISIFTAVYKLRNANDKKNDNRNIMHIVIVILIFSAILNI